MMNVDSKKYLRFILWILLIAVSFLIKNYFRAYQTPHYEDVNYLDIIEHELDSNTSVSIYNTDIFSNPEVYIITFLLGDEIEYKNVGFALLKKEAIVKKIGFVDVIIGYAPKIDKIIFSEKTTVLDNKTIICEFDEIEYYNWVANSPIFLLVNDEAVTYVECVMRDGQVQEYRSGVNKKIYMIKRHNIDDYCSINFYGNSENIIDTYYFDNK